MKAEGFLIKGHDYAIGQYIFGKSGIIFWERQPPVAMIFNNDGDTHEHAGMINCGMFTQKGLQIVGNRSGGTAIRVQVWGKAVETMPWSNNIIVDYTDSGAFTDWIMITERMAFMRVGIQMIGGSPGASDWIHLAVNIGR